MSTHSSRSRKTATESAGEVAPVVRCAPTAWLFPLDDCPHPRYATSRWQMPGRNRNEITDDGVWWVSISHQSDGPYTGTNQLTKDDPRGKFKLMMADGIARRQADVCLGNALARIYSDDLTAPDEVAGLYGGIGYFADATRICRWLASAHGSERQRRMALCVEPDQYREILLSREDREAAVSHVCEWIMGAEINISPQTVDGLLFAITKSTPKHTTDRLSWLTSCVVCRPRTTTFWRNRLVADLMEAGMGGATPGSTLLACVLPIVTNGQFKPSMEMHAEKLIHVAEAMIQAEMAVS